MSSFKPIDSKRDEFRKYLERRGVVDELTKVLVKLFNVQERPDNAMQFIFENLGQTLLYKDQYEYLRKELEESRNENAELKRVIETLKTENAKFKHYDAEATKLELKQIKKEPIENGTAEEYTSDENVNEKFIKNELISEVKNSEKNELQNDNAIKTEEHNSEISSMPTTNQPVQGNEQTQDDSANEEKNNGKLNTSVDAKKTNEIDTINTVEEEKIDAKQEKLEKTNPKTPEKAVEIGKVSDQKAIETKESPSSKVEEESLNSNKEKLNDENKENKKPEEKDVNE